MVQSSAEWCAVVQSGAEWCRVVQPGVRCAADSLH